MVPEKISPPQFHFNHLQILRAMWRQYWKYFTEIITIEVARNGSDFGMRV
jgi:hypothetical protein